MASVQIATKLINSISHTGQTNLLLRDEISRQLTQTNSLAQQDTGIYAVTNKEVIDLLFRYYDLTKKIISSMQAVQHMEELQNKLDVCDEKRADAEDRLSDCRREGEF